MDRQLIRRAQQARVPAAALAAALATAGMLAACGGGGDVIALRATPAPAAAPAAPVAATKVRLEGCVVDEYFIARSNTPVRALAADGRLLGNALSDARGAFGLHVPMGQIVSLAVDRPDGDVIKVASGLGSRALTTCLLDPSA